MIITYRNELQWISCRKQNDVNGQPNGQENPYNVKQKKTKENKTKEVRKKEKFAQNLRVYEWIGNIANLRSSHTNL